jgi:hypothetical protein
MKKLRIMKKREKRLGFYLRLRQFFTDNFYFLRKKMHTLNCKRLLPIVVIYVTVKVHVGGPSVFAEQVADVFL